MTENEPTLDQRLRLAIAAKRLVQFIYETKRRVAEPHDYGILGGVTKILVFQVRGESRTPLPGWRLLETSKVEELVVLEEAFPGSRGQSHRLHNEWDELFARVG